MDVRDQNTSSVGKKSMGDLIHAILLKVTETFPGMGQAE